MNTESLMRLARMVPLGSVPWFDLLDALGLFEKWIASTDKDKLGYVVWHFSEPIIRQQRGDRIAELARPALISNGLRRQIFLRIFDGGHIHTSRRLFGLALELLDVGILDSQTAHFWNHWHDFGEKDPAMAAELAAHVLDRLREIARLAGKESPFDRELDGPILSEGMITSAARRNPSAIVEQLLPRVVQVIIDTALPPEDDKIVFDRVWAVRSWGFHHDLSGEILAAVSEAMGLLARDQPRELDKHVAALGLTSLPHQTIAYLLLTAWAHNGKHYADQIVEYLLADENRLNIGYSSWGSGNGIAAVTRAALMAASPHCTDANLRRLEEDVLKYLPVIEREQPRRQGYMQLLLFAALDESRHSYGVSRRFGELSRKFDGANTSLPGPTEGAVWIRSPVPEKAAKHMTDEQWLAAMRKYHDDNWKSRKPADFFKGGAVELSRLLETEARNDKARFSALAMGFDKDIRPVYWEAVLRGIAAHPGETRPMVVHGQETEATQQQIVELPVETDAAVLVIRHAHNLVGEETGRWICHSIAKLAERELPNDLLEMVAKCALTAHDPDEELWQKSASGGDHYYGGDPVTFGINTTRGEAAHAVAQLLFADGTRYDQLHDAIAALVKDRSLAVRACSVECLLAMLNTHREEAVTVFLEITKDSAFPLGTMFVERFLHYAVYTHYAALRDLLLGMLKSADADVRKTAAQQIALASFRYPEAQNNLERVLRMDAVCRAAVAEVDAANLHVVEFREACRGRLVRHFEDEAPEVRDAAARCFLQLHDDQLYEESELISRFIASPAFEANSFGLLHSLESAAARLPDVVCRIAERAAEIHRTQNENSSAHWWTGQMATLVLRLYEQTQDESVKTRCLNVIDSMIELGFGNVTTELAKIER